MANLGAYLVSDYSAYINGEVVTIDGGEWLQGAGEFNMLEQIPQEMWDMLEMMIKAKRNHKINFLIPKLFRDFNFKSLILSSQKKTIMSWKNFLNFH